MRMQIDENFHLKTLTDVFEELPVEIVSSVVHAAALHQQLEQRDGLLSAVVIHPRHIHIIDKCN